MTIIIVSHLSKSDHADMTAKMSEATLPIVTVLESGKETNTMHGYLSDVDVGNIRGTVVPLGVDRSLAFNIKTFGKDVTEIGYEVRSVDGKGLVESTMLTDYKEDKDTVYANIQLKDLIDSGKEYMLVVFMNTDIGKAKYYTRFVWTEEESRYNVTEELDFILRFSSATFDVNKAKEYSKYLETSTETDHATLSKVNIHSTLEQITWGKLKEMIVDHTEPEIYITDLHEQTGSYELKYKVSVKDGSTVSSYNVVEDFRVRHTSDRMYLLDYERSMDYIFDSETYSIGPNSIYLGISDPDIEFKESSSGSAFAFVNCNRLYAFNNTENKLAYLFGFYDEDNDDVRTRWNRNSIKILKIDEAGNVKFAVSGYMNRGIHEGCTGIAVYDYDAAINAVEEQVFIESNKSAEVIINYVDKLAYVSSNDIFYVMLDQNIYEVDLLDRTAKAVVEDIGSGTYKVSKSKNVIAWQGEDLNSLNIMNLNTRAITPVEANPGENIIVLGFRGEDLVYGTVNPADIQNDQMGNPIYAMYSMKIQDSDGNILEDYHIDGVYITSVEIRGDMINLSRVVKDAETGMYVPTYDDPITYTLPAEKGSNTVGTVADEVYDKVSRIMTKSEIKVKELRVLTPNLTLYEGDRNVEVSFDRDIEKNPLYYVYDISGGVKVYPDASSAVIAAEKKSGVVVGDRNNYVWYKGNRKASNQIMDITRRAEAYEDMPSKDSTAVCLDLMLQFEGVNRNVEALISGGESVRQILEESLPDVEVIELSGCSLDSVLYYVNKETPVMAMMSNGGSMLIMGFNDQNTVVVDPKTGNWYKYGMNDSKKLFEENGNHFITYLREEK
ncbi:hypothetical protein [Butyrivibrio sp. X503]|uniref:hypothetical protein n=1 Tax=Butyrivibrio sp. X503 TaxID=2364878 RepID=UPI001A9ACA60|nr:hypothetical protein [Butyrivibrio sp. X503]